MNSAKKRLRLNAAVTPPPLLAIPGRGSTHIAPPHSHDALLRPQPVQEEEEEEEEGYLLVEEDTTDSSLIITMEDSQLKVKRRKVSKKRKRKSTDDGGEAEEGEEEEEGEVGGASESEEEGVGVEIDKQLDQSLETKSKQHNLTTVNVRNIIHEVITNEHVVAMMKAAMNETEAVPPFEPKMTRSKLKEVVQRGVVIPAWSLSPIKTSGDGNKPPQFVDIPLAEEDSSDEEYHPDEEDEDETAEDTFHESDMENSISSPRGTRLTRVEEDHRSPGQAPPPPPPRGRPRRLRVGRVSMGPPPPPKAPPPKTVTDSTFLEELHAVEEELAVCLEPYQPLSESEEEAGLMAYRTRSKRPLRNVPLGRLEAELRAPDITPDMYDSSSAHEDREWTDWLRGLMTSEVDQEEECDDEDDPEYNFLADNDEPDQEDYRDDKAVRITKKEVNELMEELFETLKEDLAGQEVDDEGHEEEEELQEETPSVQAPSVEHVAPLPPPDDGPTAALHTVKQQLQFIRRRQAHAPNAAAVTTHHTEPHTLRLSARQKRQLQRQLQQHVQLLTQIHLLTSPVVKLQGEAETTRQFLLELDVLARQAELIVSATHPAFRSAFRASNLQGALQLLEELLQTPVSCRTQARSTDARGYIRSFPVMPAELAWIFATRPVFLHPELLPCASLDPALYCPRRTSAFTAAEDCLLVLGLRNMEGSSDPPKLVSQFLLRKTLVQIRRRILQCCRPGSPDNIVKAFRYQRVLSPMAAVCRCVEPTEQRPPVEREEQVLPLWLLRSLPVLQHAIAHYSAIPPGSCALEAPPPPSRRDGARQSQMTFLRSASSSGSCSLPPGSVYPARLPEHLDFRRIGFVLLHRPRPQPAAAAVSTATGEQMARHCETLAGLRMRRRRNEKAPPPEDDVIQEEEEGRILASDDDEDGEDDGARRSGASGQSSVEQLEDDEDQRKSEDLVFAQDYLHRVCEALQVSPAVGEQLLQVLDEFSAGSNSAEDLFNTLRPMLQPWPQLLRDFAAFLTDGQARRCGLLFEQQTFERSRRFLWRLGQSLGKSSALYRQVVSALQRSSAPSPDDIQQVSSLLRLHPHLQEEVQLLFLQLHPPSATTATDSQTDTVSQNAPCPSQQTEEELVEEQEQGEEPEEELERGEELEDEQQEEDLEEEYQICADSISVPISREKVITWTRDDDRTILTSCQQKGANRRTFQEVSAHLGNKSATQVRLRFLDLMRLFYSASKDLPIGRENAAHGRTADQSQSPVHC
ncbi:unnamed protein product [Ophioblennius macclurei]